MKITFREITEDDAAQFNGAVNLVRDEGKYLFYSLRFTVEQTASFIRQHASDGLPIWGAFDETGKLIGWIDFTKGGFPEVEHAATIGMGVLYDFRGKGIGSELMERCIRSATKAGLEKLDLEVFATNEAALSMYRKKGFVEQGRKIKARKFQGSYDDLILMHKFL
jgi:ribosomal protein S18 acetylase RimI-like enzyme